MNSLMRRWQMETFGRAHLRLAEVPVPTPGRGQVLVKIGAAALNYRDLLMIGDGMGMTLDMPFTPGSDMSGEVVALGPQVLRLQPGDRVVNAFFTNWSDGIAPVPVHPFGGPGPGMLAEYVVFDEAQLVLAPQSLTHVEASTLTCAGTTAWFALAEQARTRPGDTVVVQGTGGVALFALQLARAQGARVAVISGSADKLERVKALGATWCIDRTTSPRWADAVRELTGGRGADHVLELAGGDNFEQSLQAIAQGGRISVIGMLQGTELRSSVYPLMLGRATVQGIGVGHRRALADLVRALDAANIRPVVAGSYGLTELPAALEHLARGAFGKVVVDLSRR